MTYSEACALPSCPECCCPSAFYVSARRIGCSSNQCDWSEPVDEPIRKQEPLRGRQLGQALRRALVAGLLLLAAGCATGGPRCLSSPPPPRPELSMVRAGGGAWLDEEALQLARDHLAELEEWERRAWEECAAPR